MSIGPGGHVGPSAFGEREKTTHSGMNPSEKKIQWVVLAAFGDLKAINFTLKKGLQLPIKKGLWPLKPPLGMVLNR